MALAGASFFIVISVAWVIHRHSGSRAGKLRPPNAGTLNESYPFTAMRLWYCYRRQRGSKHPDFDGRKLSHIDEDK
jgi:hypothetical protein